jgi:hypothetical protein
MTAVRHDPFIEKLRRETLFPFPANDPQPPGFCAWCSNVTADFTVYRYSVQNENGSLTPDAHVFCSIDCRRQFYP